MFSTSLVHDALALSMPPRTASEIDGAVSSVNPCHHPRRPKPLSRVDRQARRRGAPLLSRFLVLHLKRLQIGKEREMNLSSHVLPGKSHGHGMSKHEMPLDFDDSAPVGRLGMIEL